MEREAREVEEKEYASNSKEQVCLSNATEEIYNREKKGACATECNLNSSRHKWIGWGVGGPPRGDT